MPCFRSHEGMGGNWEGGEPHFMKRTTKAWSLHENPLSISRCVGLHVYL